MAENLSCYPIIKTNIIDPLFEKPKQSMEVDPEEVARIKNELLQHTRLQEVVSQLNQGFPTSVNLFLEILFENTELPLQYPVFEKLLTLSYSSGKSVIETMNEIFNMKIDALTTFTIDGKQHHFIDLIYETARKNVEQGVQKQLFECKP